MTTKTDPLAAWDELQTKNLAEHERIRRAHRDARDALVQVDIDTALGQPPAPAELARVKREYARLEQELQDSEARVERAQEAKRGFLSSADDEAFSAVETERRRIAREWIATLRREREVLADLLRLNRDVVDLEYRSALLKDQQGAIRQRSGLSRGIDQAVQGGALPFGDEQLRELDDFLQLWGVERAEQLGIVEPR